MIGYYHNHILPTNRQLKHHLKALRAVAPPASWVSARRELLMTQVRSQQAVASVEPVSSWYDRTAQRAKRTVWAATAAARGAISALAARGLAAGALALVLVFSTVGYVVHAADQALPGGSLYPVKLAVEDIRLKLATNPRQRVELQTEFAAVRLSELSTLTSRGEASLPRAEALVSDFAANVQSAAATASEVAGTSPDKGAAIARVLDDRVSQYEHDLRAATVSGGTTLAKPVARALAAANRAGTEALKVMVGKEGKPAPQVADKIGEKIKNAEDTLEVADSTVSRLAEGGAKGGAPAAPTKATSDLLARVRDQSAVAKTNLAEARKKVTEGDYQAALNIIENVQDIVDNVADTASQAAAASPATDPTPPIGKVEGAATPAPATPEGSVAAGSPSTPAATQP